MACLCVWVVASPVWPDAGLPSKVPDLKFDVVVCHRLNIEANGCMRTETFSQHASHQMNATGYTCSAVIHCRWAHLEW